ncbi:zinc finger protein 62 homolog isoform X2 [Uranotaenia lowii]|uniref:zinc finger protein 62 homolog isoform X2 n=1 Tax=Uranotaenia lowii TaxID=190385 RepID=UPI00247A73FF|nr:zinc finger protein 62 homolog isoform X2 [Uranotaenia lowii]
MNQLCRTCLRSSDELLPLFEAKIGEDFVTDMILNVLRVEFDERPNLPQHICVCCLKKVDYFYSFYQELTKCQSVLQMLLDEADHHITSSRKQMLAEVAGDKYSDGIFEEVEKLEETEEEPTDTVSYDNHLELGLDELGDVKDTQIETVVFEEEKQFEEQLIGIKIEAVEPELVVLKAETDIEFEEDFIGFEETIPVKIEIEETVPVKLEIAKTSEKRKRKPKQKVPKLEIVKTIPNKCYICQLQCENRDHFDIHLLEHKDLLPFECDLCSTAKFPIKIKTLMLLNRHFESHGFKYCCKHCPLKFRSHQPLYDHTRNSHELNPEGHTCEECGEVFAKIRCFQVHMRIHKYRRTERYKCKSCGKVCQSFTALNVHQQTHSTGPTFACPICEKTFNNENNMHKHKIRHVEQMQDAEKGHNCKECKMHFTTLPDLRVHMRSHFPDNPLYSPKTADILPATLKDSSSYPRPCEEPGCSYVAPTYVLMWSHYRKHYKQFPCNECDRKFATATILKNHVQIIHKKIRRFKCELCGKEYGYQHKYKEHMDAHKGIRAHQCRFCGQTFTHSSNLMIHERLHTDNRQHVCPICGSRLVTRAALKKHIRSHSNPKNRLARPRRSKIPELNELNPAFAGTTKVIKKKKKKQNDIHGPVEVVKEETVLMEEQEDVILDVI